MGVVLLAGGGTVGHLAPGFAVRDALRDLGHDGVFVTPGEARERGWFPAGDPEPHHVAAPRLPQGLLGRLTFPFRMARAVASARRLIRTERPASVLGLGGWPSAPTCIAASLAGIPLHLLMTDEVPGMVVRRLAKRATRIYAPTETAAAAVSVWSPKVLVVGRIVRREVLAAHRDPARFGLKEGRSTLLVVGGSLGAKGLNDRARAGLDAAVRADPGLKACLQVIHATGTEEEASLSRQAFQAMGLLHFVAPFIADIGTALQTADLVLCRGGAGTLAEVEALGRPAVIVPYPHHADRQQWKNAERLVASGQAVVLDEASLDAATFDREVIRGLPQRTEGLASVRLSHAGATIAAELVRSSEVARRGDST